MTSHPVALVALPLRYHLELNVSSDRSLARAQRRQRRRRLSATLISERLSGDLMSRGYFAAEVTVCRRPDCPPQRDEEHPSRARPLPFTGRHAATALLSHRGHRQLHHRTAMRRVRAVWRACEPALPAGLVADVRARRVRPARVRLHELPGQRVCLPRRVPRGQLILWLPRHRCACKPWVASRPSPSSPVLGGALRPAERLGLIRCRWCVWAPAAPAPRCASPSAVRRLSRAISARSKRMVSWGSHHRRESSSGVPSSARRRRLRREAGRWPAGRRVSSSQCPRSLQIGRRWRERRWLSRWLSAATCRRCNTDRRSRHQRRTERRRRLGRVGRRLSGAQARGHSAPGRR